MIVVVAANRMNIDTETIETPKQIDHGSPASQEFRGAIFGFATNGTNPDLLLLLEAGGKAQSPAWHFAPARMTSGGVNLKFGNATVWEVPWVNWDEAPFPTWTFFSSPRSPVLGEEAQ